MATGTIEPNIPNTPNTVTDSWEPLVGQHIIGRQGDNHVSLTEWAASNSSKPSVASGSAIEVNGSMITYDSDTSITNETGLTSGTIYLLIDTSDAVNAFPTFVNDAPTWNASKNGFYRGANERYTGHQMEWDGSTSYTDKIMFDAEKDIEDLRLRGTINPDGGYTYDNVTIKAKMFTGTLSNYQRDVATGLTASDVVGISYSIRDSNGHYFSDYASSSGGAVSVYMTGGTLRVYFDVTNCASASFKVVIYYKV